MKTVGIICEYNPFHLGHKNHIEQTKQLISGNSVDDVLVVGVISGNFVQRGDFAIFNKYARAKMAISCGVDLVIEMPTPYVLQSAEGFSESGVYLLDALGICDYLSFGSETGDLETIKEAASSIVSINSNKITKEWLNEGYSYASAQQKAAESVIGKKAEIFKSPNNVLGIEYIKALKKLKSPIKPITIKRTGGNHDSETGYSATALRKFLMSGNIPTQLMPEAAANIIKEEITLGRGPVSLKNAEQAILSRLRMLADYSNTSGVSEGLEKRFKRYATAETSVEAILNNTKTKRYPMSRLRRLLLCAALEISKETILNPPPYIKILAMNSKGKKLLAKARKKSKLPILTKPAAVYKMDEAAIKLFKLESSISDFYVLAYPNEEKRNGGNEWRQTPIINP